MTRTYDAVVLGLGGMGAAAAYHLAKRGLRVLGLEQFPFVHQRGSSHGHTRIIRTAYYEHPDYIPLVRRAYANWHELEQRIGRQLLTRCDCLSIGPADGELIRGVSRAAQSLPAGAVSTLCSKDLSPFVVPDHYVGRLEHEAGYLLVEECVQAHLDAAREHNADLHCDEPATGWSVRGDSVEVCTKKGQFNAAKLVITAGAWATRLLDDLGVPLSVMRQTLLWFKPKSPETFRRDRFPIFLVQTPQGEYYGLPMIDSRGVKLARHYGAPELTSPDDVDWVVHEHDVKPVQGFIDEFLPKQFTRYENGQVCMYTLSPDRHFVIDQHPHFKQVCVAAGFSGHGFKFASVVGELLSEMAIDGKAALPMFAINRAMKNEPGK